MMKHILLGVINILLGSFFLFILLTSNYSYPSSITPATTIKYYWPNVILSLLFVGNGWLMYQQLVKKDKKHFVRHVLVTAFIVICFLILLAIGMAFSSSAPPADYKLYQENISISK